jgi:hypothetical protein
MTLSSQQYADLMADSYADPVRGADGRYKDIVRHDVTYKVLEHVDRANGYQGTIYQRADTGEIVVAHRGTEFDRQPLRDGGLADGGMVFGRVNAQARDAISLTKRAIDIAEELGKMPGKHAPQVTVTGHSLGGALAQVSAHHFGLYGEAFNPYGAVSLEMRIPEGGGRFVNHVMAADVVSAASPHYGHTRYYASEREIQTLGELGGYDNAPSLLDARIPLVAAIARIDSHYKDNFLDVDSQGRPDVSVLDDPRTRQRAADHAPMIARYRLDVLAMRGELTTLGQGGLLPDVMRTAMRNLQGTLAPGEPGRREAQRRDHPQTPIREVMERGEVLGPDHWRTPLAVPSGPVRPADAALHRQLRDGISKLGFDGARDHSADGPGSRLAAELLLQCRQDGLKRADHVLMGSGAQARVFAVQGALGDPSQLRTHVELSAALQSPATESLGKVEQLGRQQAEQQALGALQAQQVPQPEPSGPSLSR